jgi:hypothetical protein
MEQAKKTPKAKTPLATAAATGRSLACGSALTLDFTPDEIEFMKAMDKYKRDYRRPFPTWHEVLAVLLSLGYHK